jgi:hypothetical protein
MRPRLPAMLLAPGGLGQRLAFYRYRRFVGLRSWLAVSSVASGRIEFVSQAQPRAQTVLRTIHSLPVALHAMSPRRSYFQFLAGSTAREGLAPSSARLLPSALAADVNRRNSRHSQRHSHAQRTHPDTPRWRRTSLDQLIVNKANYRASKSNPVACMKSRSTYKSHLVLHRESGQVGIRPRGMAWRRGLREASEPALDVNWLRQEDTARVTHQLGILHPSRLLALHERAHDLSVR